MSNPVKSLWMVAVALFALQEGVAAQSSFTFEDQDGRLKLLEEGKPVLVYNYGMQLAPGVAPEYRRSSYVHPLWDPEGNVLTDDFPDDHPHHRGLSWMWPRVVVAGETYDLWHLRGIRQVFEQWLARETGPEHATVGVRNSWQVEGRRVLEEEVWLRAHEASSTGRAIDVELTLRALEPIQILGQSNENKGYGGVVLRFAPREETRITTAEGVQAEDSDRSRAVWADESGLFGGMKAFSGAAIFQHPDNPGYPAEWTLRHYGFVGSAWPGLQGTRLTPGEPVTLRYRIWVHSGDADKGGVAEAYRAYRSKASRTMR